MSSDRRRLSATAVYFAVQAVATLAWWAVIAWSPAWRRWFAFGDDGASLWTFFPADLLCWCVGSLAAAWGDWRRSSWSRSIAWAVSGAITASVLQAATLALHTLAGLPGVLLMAPALVLTVFFTWRSTRDR